ncbi:MAG: PTS lactose/cellobiose transporter subunit IIA [Anaerorhabdus sp.]|uniref:PTS lactose/cellobiose transporter subunit IIA n=1 Tax=Anaerorhabdus sp. TaxID=1872524 RepID=UPI003A8B84B1
MDQMEMIIFEIINYGGTAKGLAYEALEAAEQGDYEKAEQLLKESDENLVKAHQIQTTLIQDEAAGKHHDVTVLFVHAQDHLMTAMEARTLIEYIIKMHKKIDSK